MISTAVNRGQLTSNKYKIDFVGNKHCKYMLSILQCVIKQSKTLRSWSFKRIRTLIVYTHRGTFITFHFKTTVQAQSNNNQIIPSINISVYMHADTISHFVNQYEPIAKQIKQENIITILTPCCHISLTWIRIRYRHICFLAHSCRLILNPVSK